MPSKLNTELAEVAVLQLVFLKFLSKLLYLGHQSHEESRNLDHIFLFQRWFDKLVPILFYQVFAVEHS